MRQGNTKYISIIIAALSIALFILSCSFKPSPKKVVEDYVRAYNTHRVDDIMALYSDDILFEITGFGLSVSGKESVKGIAEYDSVLNTILTLSDISVNGDTVFCSLTENNDWCKAAEIPAAYYPKTTFIVKNYKISQIHAEIADSSLENFEGVLDYFVHWGNENYPDKMRRMAPDGIFIYNAENGETMVSMLREWKAATKQEQRESILRRAPIKKEKSQK